MRQQQSGPYVTIYTRFLNAVCDRLADRPKWRIVESIQYVTENLPLFGAYWNSFKKDERDEFIKIVKARREHMR